jgi:hypothetical protein
MKKKKIYSTVSLEWKYGSFELWDNEIKKKIMEYINDKKIKFHDFQDSFI